MLILQCPNSFIWNCITKAISHALRGSCALSVVIIRKYISQLVTVRFLYPTFMMTSSRSDSKPQNNDLATQRTQNKDNSFGFEITLLVDGTEGRTSTLMESGLLLLLSIFLRSDGVSDQETINCIKIHGFQEMFFLLSAEEHITCFSSQTKMNDHLIILSSFKTFLI